MAPLAAARLEVATARFRGQGGRILPRTLGEALDHARSFGGLVVATGHSAKWALERLEIGDEPWVLSIEARALVERILGDALLWTPDDAARALRPATRGDQRSLLLSREAIAALDIEPLGARARQLLRAHLLVAQTLGEETHGLERRSLFRRYDPRALRPVRYVSLETVLAERPRLVPRGAVARGLSGLVLETDPGEARAAARLYGLAPAPPLDAGEAEGKPLSRGRERGSGKEPVRRRGRGVALLRVPIADELAVGALRIEPDSEDRESAPARRIRCGRAACTSTTSACPRRSTWSAGACG